MPAKISIIDRINMLKDLDHLKGKSIVHSHSVKYNYFFNVHCPTCSNDNYVTKGACTGVFTSEYKALKLNTPCRCGSFKHTKETLRIKAEAHCIREGYTFIGYVGDFNIKEHYMTKCKVGCTVHPKEVKTLTLNEILHVTGRLVCRSCTKQSNIELADKEINKVVSSNYIVFHTKSLSEVAVLCTRCSFDNYVGVGLCSGVWYTNKASILKGGISCRCSKTPSWTLAQREYQIKQIMKDEGNKLSFDRWTTPHLGVDDTRFNFTCQKHGVFNININNFTNSSKRCRGCRDENMRWAQYSDRHQEDDYLYIVEMSNEVESFCKVGRSFNPEANRFRDYRKYYSCIEHIIIKSTHYKVFSIEQKLKMITKPYRYTPLIPFGGSISECTSLPKEDIMKLFHSIQCHIPEAEISL